MAGKNQMKPGCGSCKWRGPVTYAMKPPSTKFGLPSEDLREGTAECNPPKPARAKQLRLNKGKWQVWVPESHEWHPGRCVLLRERDVQVTPTADLIMKLRESVVSGNSVTQIDVKKESE